MNDDELRSHLHAAGRTMEPDAASLQARIGQRMAVRRRHRATTQLLSVGIAVLALGSTAVALRDDRPDRMVGAEQSVPPALSVEPSLDLPVMGDPSTSAQAVPADTFPAADDRAVNILVVGADNGACLSEGSVYDDAFGDRSSIGSRSDTIMIVRIDPAAGSAAVLSFPRDLWVSVSGRGKSRLNSTFVRDDPALLIDTLAANFGVGVDHFVQLDFCSFTTIVDAVGGVAVPFAQPVRDTDTGLYVSEAGCHVFDGEAALAYVRSRRYETFDATSGQWVADPASDVARITRQQYFLERTLAAVFETGPSDVGVLRDLIRAARDSVVVDSGLTLNTMLSLAGELRAIDPTTIGHFQIEGTPTVVSGAAVMVPALDTPTMQPVLALFRGHPVVPAPTSAETTATAPELPPVTCP
jgi:LCP family protein required for cell wall assembly